MRVFFAAIIRSTEISKRQSSRVWSKTASSRSSGKSSTESRARHENYGGSVYLLEPEVKEGEGGLRDIQTARWIARAKLKAKDFDALALNGIVSATDIATLKESQDFLLRVRNELHFSTGKHQDQLTFEHQEKVSAALGFEGEGALRARRGIHAQLLSPRGADQPAIDVGHSPSDRLRQATFGATVCVRPNFARGDSRLEGTCVRHQARGY